MNRGRGRNRGILSERPIAKVLVVLGVVIVLVGFLASSSTLISIGWAAILASAIAGAFFNV